MVLSIFIGHTYLNEKVNLWFLLFIPFIIAGVVCITRPAIIFGGSDLSVKFPWYTLGIIAGLVISIETSLTNITLKLLKEVRSEISSF